MVAAEIISDYSGHSWDTYDVKFKEVLTYRFVQVQGSLQRVNASLNFTLEALLLPHPPDLALERPNLLI